MIRNDAAGKSGRGAAVRREIIMPGDIEYAGRGDGGVVNLDFVGLGARGGTCGEYDRQRGDGA